MLVTNALKDDHRCIGRMLTIVQKASNCLDYGQQVPPHVFLDAGDFFDHFVDAYHCSQEEDALFPAIATLALPPDTCSLEAFRADHAQARQIAAAISGLSTRFAAGDGRGRRPLVLAVRSYVNLLWSHIIREDHLLFVVADDLLPPTAKQQVVSACARIESRLMNAATREHYNTLLNALEGMATTWTLPDVGPAPVEVAVPLRRPAVLSAPGSSMAVHSANQVASM